VTSKNYHREGCSTRRNRRHTRHKSGQSEMSRKAGHQGAAGSRLPECIEKMIRLAMYSPEVIAELRKIVKE